MYEMYKLKYKNNKGSATVEMCVVVPIILWICVNIMFVFMDVIGDSLSQGECYFAIYSFSDNQRPYEGDYTQPVLEKDHHLLCQGKQTNNGGDGYFYTGNRNIYKTEYDLCTIRLRRWQLYGDVLQE